MDVGEKGGEKGRLIYYDYGSSLQVCPDSRLQDAEQPGHAAACHRAVSSVQELLLLHVLD